MRIFPDSKRLSASAASDSEIIATRFEASRKKRRHAYLAWLCLGSHYLYLDKPVKQGLFWVTAGGLLIWWLVDLLRIPAMVGRHNRRTSADLIEALHHEFEQRFQQEARAPRWPSVAATGPAFQELPPFADTGEPQEDGAGRVSVWRSGRRDGRAVAGTVLVAAFVTTLALYVMTPPPLHSRAVLEPSFRTLRTVNVRLSPSTASPVRGVVRKNVVLKGQVERAGGKRWLWITRGAHSDGYVALHNLEKR